MSINRVNISGNLTREPELRETAGGMAILKFGVAVNDRRKVDGDWTDVANFIDCVMFGTRAESVARFLTKGSKVAIEGKLRWSQWEKNGEKRSKVEVVVDDLEFMSAKGDAPERKVEHMGDLPASIPDDEIPFHHVTPQPFSRGGHVRYEESAL